MKGLNELQLEHLLTALIMVVSAFTIYLVTGGYMDKPANALRTKMITRPFLLNHLPDSSKLITFKLK
jgi:hypothetical protein